MPTIRELAKLLRRTPLHPQWLLGRRRPPKDIDTAIGVILDIGAADRWITSHLSPGAKYVALDYPSTTSRFYATRPDIFANASQLPIGNEKLDNVICLEVIEHLRDPRSALTEIHRVLKPSGRAWISLPFMYPIHNAPFDFQRYTEFGLRREIDIAGLELVWLDRSNHALRSSAILTCLSIAGGANDTKGALKVLLLPCAVMMVVVLNIAAWIMSALWPDWDAISTNYNFLLRKPAASAADPDNSSANPKGNAQ